MKARTAASAAVRLSRRNKRKICAPAGVGKAGTVWRRLKASGPIFAGGFRDLRLFTNVNI